MTRHRGLRVSAIGLAMLGTVVLAAGCAGPKAGPAVDVDEEPWTVRTESPLDTTETQVESGAGDLVVDNGAGVETPTVEETRPGSPPEAVAPSPTLPDPDDFTPGWRVQIFASSSMVNADNVAQKARRRVAEAVYVEYQPPMYKVRVGDFLTKAEAQSMATRVRAEGFDAWIVETLVHRPRR